MDANDPKQFMRDPATGDFVEGRWVCPEPCKAVNVGPRCAVCGWDRAGLMKAAPSISDDTGEFVPLSERPDPPTIIDPPGGSD